MNHNQLLAVSSKKGKKTMKSYIEDVINAAAVRVIKTATKYISEKITVKATKRCVKKLKTEFGLSRINAGCRP